MRNEIGLTPATKKLLANKPPEPTYPPRDKASRLENASMRRAHFQVIIGKE